MSGALGLTAEQIEIRRTGIGASEIAAICGISPWAGPHDVWRRKVEPASDPQADLLHLRMGHRFEGPLAEEWEERNPGFAIDRPMTTLRHKEPQLSHMLASPDGLIYERGGQEALPDPVALWEAKTCGWRAWEEFGEPGSDQIPDHYMLQCQWALEVLGLDECYLSVLVAGFGATFATFRIPRHKNLIDDLVRIGECFWRRHVETGDPPEPDHHAGSSEWLHARFPRDKAPMREAAHDEVALAYEYRDACLTADQAKQTKDQIASRIKLRIGEAAGIEGPFGSIKWPTVKGKISWAEAAKQAGVTTTQAEAHRGDPSRRLTTRWK